MENRYIILYILILIVIPMNAQSVEKMILSGIGKGESKYRNEAQTYLKQGQLNNAAMVYSLAVKQAQEQRNAGRGVDGDLLAEYGYALALHHDYEAALINIDRARIVGAKYGDFYSAQVLTLMGNTQAAHQFMKKAKVPDWISGVYQGLTEKYKITTSINRDAPETALKRANKLAANGQTIQAIVLFEELKTLYPQTYIIYIDYSTVWESLGHYTYAAQLLQQGIGLIPQGLSEDRHVFETHLAKVDKYRDRVENASWIKRILGTTPPKMMTYIGASAANDMYSLNGRMGFYTSNKISASLNLGLNYGGEQFSGSIGISAYKTWGILVGGLGITDTFGKDTNILSLTPSVGLSFLSKEQTSSFDIMVNGYIPFSSGQKIGYGISLGKTIYFDLNGLLK